MLLKGMYAYVSCFVTCFMRITLGVFFFITKACRILESAGYFMVLSLQPLQDSGSNWIVYKIRIWDFLVNRHLYDISGGLLIASAHFGAYVCGTDIDYNTVHGLGE